MNFKRQISLLGLALLLPVLALSQDLDDVFDDGGASNTAMILKVSPTQWLHQDYGLGLQYTPFFNFAFDGNASFLGRSRYIWESYFLNGPFDLFGSESESPITDLVRNGISVGGEVQLCSQVETLFGYNFFTGGQIRRCSLEGDQSITIIEPRLGYSYLFHIGTRGALERKG
ncbi:MAG: hypothetical protein ACFB10_25355, partial [Salibacteraceae bacterium]